MYVLPLLDEFLEGWDGVEIANKRKYGVVGLFAELGDELELQER